MICQLGHVGCYGLAGLERSGYKHQTSKYVLPSGRSHNGSFACAATIFLEQGANELNKKKCSGSKG